MKKRVLGILVACLSLPFLGVLIAIVDCSQRPNFDFTCIRQISEYTVTFSTIFGIPLTLVAFLLIGLPFLSFFSRKAELTPLNVSLSGALFGVIYTMLILYFMSYPIFTGWRIERIGFFAIVGFVIGGTASFIYWKLASKTYKLQM